MSGLNGFLSQPIVERIGWALVHFIWQGAAVALLLAIGLLLLRRRSPNVRYLVGCVALLAMTAAPVVTMLIVSPNSGGTTAGEPLAFVLPEVGEPVPEISRTGAVVTIAEPPPILEIEAPPAPLPRRSLWENISSTVEAHLPWLVVGWLVGVILFSIRLLGGWIKVHRMKGSGASPASGGLQQVLQRLSHQLRLTRPVRLLESALAQAPIAIGWLRPVILLPASALTNLTPEQLEAILAHELAHVRRYDYLVNLFQTVIETLLFYHPAVHWVSHRIRVEREHCCDDLAVSVSGDSVSYARTLAALAEPRAPTARLAVAARSGSLLTRVRRLLSVTPPKESRASRWLSGFIALAIILALAAGFHISTVVVRAAAEEPEQTKEDQAYPDYSAMPTFYSEKDMRMPTPEEIPELGALWPKVPLEQNAAYYFARAVKAIGPKEDIPDGSSSGEKPYAGDVAAFEKWVGLNQPAFRLMREGFKQGVCRPVVLLSLEHGQPVAYPPFLARIRHLARTCADAGFLAELQQRPDAAAEAYAECLRLGIALRQHGVLMQELVGIAVSSIGQSNLDALVAHGGLNEETLRTLIHRLREAEVRSDEPATLWAAELAFGEAMMSLSKESGTAILYDKWRKQRTAMTQIIGERTLPELLQQSVAKEIANIVTLDTREVPESLIPAVARSLQELGRMDFRLRVTQARAATAIYQKRHGRLPATLDALCPDILHEVPIDPFSGKPIRYAKTADGWKLWSVGYDLKDDGGEASLVDEKGWIGPDFVYTNEVRSNIDRRSHGKIKNLPQPIPATPEPAEELRFFQYDVRDLLVDMQPVKLLEETIEAIGKENWDAAGVISEDGKISGVPGVVLQGMEFKGQPGRVVMLRQGYLIVNHADGIHEQVKAALADLRKAGEELVIRIRFVQPNAELLRLLEQTPSYGALTVRTPDGAERQMQTPFQISFLPKDVIVRDGILAEARVFAKVGQTAKGSVGMYVPKPGEPETRTFRELAYRLTPDTLLADDKFVVLNLDINNVTTEAGGAAATKTWSAQIRLPFNGAAVLEGLENLGSDVLILLSVLRTEEVEVSELPKKPPQASGSKPSATEVIQLPPDPISEATTPPKLLMDTVKKFIASADSGDVEAASVCYWPRNDPERRAKDDVRDWAEFRKANPEVQFRPVSVYWTDKRALVISNSFQGDPKRAESHGVVVLTFERWTEDTQSGWGLSDIDLDPLEGLQREIGRFLERNSGCKHWYENNDPAAAASKSAAEEILAVQAQARAEKAHEPTRLPFDGRTEFVGHSLPDFAAEIEKLKAEIEAENEKRNAQIAEAAKDAQEEPPILLEMRDIAIEAPAGGKAESPYEPMTVLSSEEYLALVERVKSTKSMTTVSAPHLILFPGKRQLRDLGIQGSYISGYTVKDGFALPVLEGYMKSGCYVDAEVVVDGDTVVFKRLRYKRVGSDFRLCSATFSVGEKPESQAITVDVSELVATTYTATLEKPEEVRLKSGKTLVLPYQVTVERSFSNLRSLVRDDDFREKPGPADQVYDPNKTVRLILVTATILESGQSDLPNPAKELTGSTPELPEKAKERTEPTATAAKITLEEIVAGINSSRSRLQKVKVTYSVKYTGKNWGWIEEGDKVIQRDDLEGNYACAISPADGTAEFRHTKIFFWRKPDLSRAPEKMEAYNGSFTASFQPGKLRGWIKGADRAKSFLGAVHMPHFIDKIQNDTWKHALETGGFALEGMEVLDGRECYVLSGRCVVKSTSKGYPVKVWIDPGRGFGVRRLECYNYNEPGQVDDFGSYDVLTMTEVEDGLWFPKLVRYRHGKEIKVKEIMVNEDVPEKTFHIAFPKGTVVTDEIAGSRYFIGEP